jgi:hypothetical protein
MFSLPSLTISEQDSEYLRKRLILNLEDIGLISYAHSREEDLKASPVSAESK